MNMKFQFPVGTDQNGSLNVPVLNLFPSGLAFEESSSLKVEGSLGGVGFSCARGSSKRDELKQKTGKFQVCSSLLIVTFS
jgi:hypothetical protein